MSQLYILIGPKGAGKSYVGRLLQQRKGIHFIDVERIHLAYGERCQQKNIESHLREALTRIEAIIAELLQTHNSVSFETTAAVPTLQEFISTLQSKYTTRLIGVNAPLNICLERVMSRNQARHLPASEELVTKVYEITTTLPIELDAKIENVGLNDEAILKTLFSAVD